MCMLFVHISLGGAFPKRHRANCGVIAIICKVPILGRHMLHAYCFCILLSVIEYICYGYIHYYSCDA
jgi:hypothetical protein